MSKLPNESSTSYAIIGLGKIGTAIAQAFARQGIDVAVAGRRPLDALGRWLTSLHHPEFVRQVS
jgi:predicted dinucleotide-binding enzyme